ncbi:acyl-CoA dehydrogenase family protein [Actinoplanes sp. NPDC051859]|uniref:acyl-CoA dehydrogenase family protein n=1 Tax=Actinoplanes sp. NPDC051859 TaxID=3363909 RepID=UPI00379A9A94
MGPDFALDDAQQAIVRLADEVLADDVDNPERLGKSLAQAGLLTLAVPEALGGAGLGVLETSLVLAELARRAAAVPATSTLGLGVLPVARWGSPEHQRDLLAGVGEGRVLTAALAEPGDPLPDTPRTTATSGWRVTGTKTGVTDAEQAYRILVPVRRHTGGTAVALIDPGAKGVTVRRTATSAGTSEFTVRMDGVAAEPLGPEADHRCVADLHRFAVAAACAAGDGALAGALALTAEHLRTRHQFGRPLATFQAVAQQIADVYVTSRTLHLAVLSACWRLDARHQRAASREGAGREEAAGREGVGRRGAGREDTRWEEVAGRKDIAREELASPRNATRGKGQGESSPERDEVERRADDDLWVAAYWLTSEALPAVRSCHHLHGGLGLAVDYPLHRYSALLRDLARRLGGAEHCLHRLGGRVVHRPD